jgi:hypothetical protein
LRLSDSRPYTAEKRATGVRLRMELAAAKAAKPGPARQTGKWRLGQR